jgi:hypothetical protein
VHRVHGEGAPPVIIERVAIPLEEELQHTYRQLERDFLVTIEGRELVASTSAVLSAKLRQIASGFVYRDQRAVRLSFTRVEQLRRDLDATEGSVLILYEFSADRDLILSYCPDVRLLSEEALRAWNTGRLKGLLMHSRSGGHGLNLQQGGREIIWYSLPWRWEQFSQANARLARPGQTAEYVRARLYITPNSIEERVAETLEAKAEEEWRLLAFAEKATSV